MPDATEWLIEYTDSDGEDRHDHIADREHAIEYLRQLIGQGKTATLYQRVPFEVQIGVTVKAPRKRRKTPSPADKPGSDTPTGPGNGEAGEPKGAAGPDAQDVNGADTSGAPAPLPNPVGPSNPAGPARDCEARLDSAPACPGPVTWDSLSCGWFCGLHMAAIPPSGRIEMHRRHASRNRPVRVAHAG